MRMIKLAVLGLFAAGAAAGLPASPAAALTIQVSVDSFKDGGVIPNQYGFCVPAAQGHTAPGPDISPRISWSKGPAGTKSYAVIVTYTDSPTIRDNMNKEGVTVAADMPRRTFFHMVLIDIPAGVTSISKGAESKARVPHGKQDPAKVGVHGINDFGIRVFPNNEQMKGGYFGYDGPCPPWNDERPHHYHFTVYALSVPSLDIGGAFDGPTAMAAMQGKVLAQGEANGYYSQNPAYPAKPVK